MRRPTRALAALTIAFSLLWLPQVSYADDAGKAGFTPSLAQDRPTESLPEPLKGEVGEVYQLKGAVLNLWPDGDTSLLVEGGYWLSDEQAYRVAYRLKEAEKVLEGVPNSLDDMPLYEQRSESTFLYTAIGLGVGLLSGLLLSAVL